MAAAWLAAPCLAQPSPMAAEKIDPQSLSIAKEIVELAYPPEARQALFARNLEAVMTQSRAAATEADGGPLDPGAEAILDRFTARALAAVKPIIAETSPALFAAFARAYAQTFTRDELLQIRAFVATPAGARFTQRSADVVGDPEVAEANIAYSARVRAAVEPLQEEARQALARHYRVRQR
jgi:hypothetical protein